MYPTRDLKEKFRLFSTIFFPILIYQFANFSASFVDTMMTGQYSTKDLAGVSMASSLWNPFFSLVTGVISALIPIIGQHLGRGSKDRIKSEVYQFFYISLFLSVFLLLVMGFGARQFLTTFGLEPDVLQVAQDYLSYLLLGIVPFLLFSVCRSFFDGLGLTRLSMYLMLLLLPFNIFFNYILIYGRFGLPKMGGAGAGLGTSLTYWAVLVIILVVMKVHPAIRSYELEKPEAFDWQLARASFQLGLPIGLQIFAEVAIFAVVGLFMSRFSSTVIAAHQAAMNFATLMYAFPLSISMALPILVSYEVGANREKDALTYGRMGRLVAGGFAVLTLSFLYLFRASIAGVYGQGQDFIQLTSVFLTYSLFFQFGDAYTAPLQGILRGYKDTTYPFIIGVSVYWSISLPLAFILQKVSDVGPEAYWIGLIAGMLTCGSMLNLRLKKLTGSW